MALGGYANHVGRVNLTTGEVRYEQIPEEWARKYIGARGLGVRYCLEAGPKVDPFGEENILCFGTPCCSAWAGAGIDCS